MKIIYERETQKTKQNKTIQKTKHKKKTKTKTEKNKRNKSYNGRVRGK